MKLTAVSQISAEIQPKQEIQKSKPEEKKEASSGSPELKVAAKDPEGKGQALDKVA